MSKKQKDITRKIFLFVAPLALIVGFLVFSLTTNKAKPSESTACNALSFTGEIDLTATVAIFEGKKVTIPALAFEDNIKENVLGVASGEKWIEVDLSEQKVRAWEGDQLYTESLVSTGLPWWPTPTGEFRIWAKLRATKMEGGTGRYYYNLPNVPYVMFFQNDKVPGYKGFSLHGTYWHNDFGRVHSHGCVNLPTPIAEKLYYWVSPILPEGKRIVYSAEDNPGTRVVIHE